MRYSEIFKEAERLYRLGLACHWLHARSKRPIESGWGSGPRKEWKYLSETYTADLNLGVRLGTPSQLSNGYLAVVDVDVKSTDKRHRHEALVAVQKLLGNVDGYPCVVSGRGNGSRHYYCVTPKPFKTFNPAQSEEIVKVHMPSKKPSKKELSTLTEKEIEKGVRLSHAWEISFYSDGRQVVLPPSVHPDSGELYQWKVPLTAADDLPLVDLENVEGLEATPRETAEKPRIKEEDVQLEGFEVAPVDLDWLPISDEVRDAIQNGTGVADRSGYLLKASSALISIGLTQNEVLTVLTDPETFLGAVGYDHAKTKSRARAAAWVYRYTFKKVETERTDASPFGVPLPAARKLSPEEQAAQDEDFTEERHWRQDLDRTKNGDLKPTLKNIDLIFSNCVENEERTPFIEDLFANRIEYACDTPWGGASKEYIKDIDMILVKRWLADAEGLEPSRDAILEATSLVAHRKRVHPVRDWLDSLKWDGVKRIDTWIKDYCEGEAPEPYLSEISRKFLLAMVKRIFEPGCQWDYVIVLEGKQGRYKSSAARAIAGDKWFMDNLPDLKDKDSMLNLQGKWLIELGELADVKRADYNLVKAYLVRRTDTVRPHYGRLMADVPRQSVFIGTINEGQYLKDPTGNRRYWPVKVGTCDAAGIAAAREQLFAEAMHVYRNHPEVLMLSEEANEQATEQQEDRRVDDDESEMRHTLLEFMESPKSATFKFDKFQIRQLMIGTEVPWGAWGSKGYHLNVAAQALSNLGFVRCRRSNNERYWSAPDSLLKKYCHHSKKVMASDGSDGSENDDEYDFL